MSNCDFVLGTKFRVVFLPEPAYIDVAVSITAAVGVARALVEVAGTALLHVILVGCYLLKVQQLTIGHHQPFESGNRA